MLISNDFEHFYFRPDFEGCILAYRDMKAIEKGARIIEDHPCMHFKIGIEIAIFRPVVGKKLKGL